MLIICHQGSVALDSLRFTCSLAHSHSIFSLSPEIQTRLVRHDDPSTKGLLVRSNTTILRCELVQKGFIHVPAGVLVPITPIQQWGTLSWSPLPLFLRRTFAFLRFHSFSRMFPRLGCIDTVTKQPEASDRLGIRHTEVEEMSERFIFPETSHRQKSFQSTYETRARPTHLRVPLLAYWDPLHWAWHGMGISRGRRSRPGLGQGGRVDGAMFQVRATLWIGALLVFVGIGEALQFKLAPQEELCFHELAHRGT